MLCRLLGFVTFFFAAGCLLAQDFEKEKLNNWHQWRGPLATGVAPNATPPTEWSEEKNIQWKVAIPGQGSASPVVWGDRIFILTSVKTERTADTDKASDQAQLKTTPNVRLVANTGADSGSTTLLAQRDEEDSPRDRGSEAEDRDRKRPEGGRRGRGDFGRGGGFGRGGRGFGGRGFGGGIPTNFHQFIVLCLDRRTGETIWQRTATDIIPHEGHHQTGSFASASPITDGKFVYAFFGSRGLFCFDMDGNPQWQVDLGNMQTRMAFGEGASPALYGNTLLVTWDHEGDDFIVAIDARNGHELWRKDRDEPTTWATPLVVEGGGHTQVITPGSNFVRSYDLKSGDLIWECAGLGSNPIATPVLYKNLAIVMSGHHDPAGFAVPLTARGDVTDSDQVAWHIEGSTPYVSSPVLYDGLLYFTKSRNAVLSVVKAETGEYVVNQKRMPGLESIYASPVAAGGHVYFCSREGDTIVYKTGDKPEVVAANQLDETIDASPAIVGNQLIIRGSEHLYSIAED